MSYISVFAILKTEIVRQKGFINFVPILIASVVILVVVGLGLRATTSGKNFFSQQVLSSSEDDNSSQSNSSNSGKSGEEEDHDDDKGGSSGPSSGSLVPTSTSESEEESTEVTTASGVRVHNESQKDGKMRTEIKFGEDEKLKTKVEEGGIRTTVVSGGVKVLIERREDRVVVKAEREDGSEVEVGADELVQIKQRLGKISIATAGAKLAVITNGIPAVSDFPIRVDMATNALSVVTPAGEKVVTILPDQAVANLIAANIIDRLAAASVADNLTTENVISAASQVVTLGLEKGTPVFEILGLKDHKLLGLIPVTTTVRSLVSAETGQVVKIYQSFFDSVIDFFSID